MKTKQSDWWEEHINNTTLRCNEAIYKQCKEQRDAEIKQITDEIDLLLKNHLILISIHTKSYKFSEDYNKFRKKWVGR